MINCGCGLIVSLSVVPFAATENRSVGGSIPPLGTIPYLFEIIKFFHSIVWPALRDRMKVD